MSRCTRSHRGGGRPPRPGSRRDAWRGRLATLGALAATLGCGPTSHTPDASAPDSATVTLDTCFAGLAPTGNSPFVGTLSFESLDGRVRVRLARQPGQRPFVGETYPYDLVRFAIERDGQTECITDRAALSYDFGHHNWSDTATAEGSATFTVELRYDLASAEPDWVDTLQVGRDAPLTLRSTGCDAIPPDLNHCLLRVSP